MTEQVLTEDYGRVFAIDRGRGTEYARWKAWKASRPHAQGYGMTEGEAKKDLKERYG